MDNFTYTTFLSFTTLPLYYFFNPSFAFWYAFSSLSHVITANLINIQYNDLVKFGLAFAVLFSSLQAFSSFIIMSEVAFEDILHFHSSSNDPLVSLIAAVFLYSFLISPLVAIFPLESLGMLIASLLGSFMSTYAMLYKDPVLEYARLINQFLSSYNIEKEDKRLHYQTIIDEATKEGLLPDGPPDNYLCRISFSIMVEPAYDDTYDYEHKRKWTENKYEYSNLVEWVDKNPTNPFTRNPLLEKNIKKDKALAQEIANYIDDLEKKINNKTNLNRNRP